MANDLNRCEFIGRLGKDPEQRSMPNGKAVCNISIAVGETWKDQSGQKQERTTWVPVVAFDKLAEIMGQYLTKGSRIFVAGKFSVRKWQDQSGQDRWSTEVIATEMLMLDTRQGDGGQQQGRNEYAEQSQRAAARTAQHHAAPQQGEPQGDDFFDDDIPF